jgi:hypothetical protein
MTTAVQVAVAIAEIITAARRKADIKTLLVQAWNAQQAGQAFRKTLDDCTLFGGVGAHFRKGHDVAATPATDYDHSPDPPAFGSFELCHHPFELCHHPPRCWQADQLAAVVGMSASGYPGARAANGVLGADEGAVRR